MTRPLRIQYPGALYYISQHSNSSIALFKNDDDRKVFLDILTASKEIYNVSLHGFVLLKDHFHLLAETPNGNLSEFMRHMNITYTSYFNRRHHRKGHLYGGRFKSVVVEKDLFLAQVSLYLHLNPIKLGGLKRKSRKIKLAYLAAWKWSSLPGYMGNYPRYSLIDHQDVLQGFGGDTPLGRRQYEETLHHQMDNGFSLKSKVVGQVLLGSIPFIEKMKEQLAASGDNREQPEVRKIEHFLLREKILKELESCLRCRREQLLHSPGDLRAVTMDMLYRYGGLTNPEIGSLMDLDYSSVSLGRKRIQQRRTREHHLNAKIIVLEKRLQRMQKEYLENFQDC